MRKKNRVGLGTFPLAGIFSKISGRKAREIVKLFLDEGGYYIDTAPVYGFGRVETLLGEVLKSYLRESYTIATKCGYIDVEGKTFQTVQKSGKFKDVIRECEKSLKRLGLDYIDVYFVHSPDPNIPFDETMEALIKLQNDGKIKEIGVSNVNLQELKDYNRQGRVKFVQNRFSLINRSVNSEFATYMTQHNIGLVPYQVIDRGQLTEKVIEGQVNLRRQDIRIRRPDWQPEKLNVLAEWVKNKLSPIAKKLNITIGQLSIAWALYRPYMSFVIVGLTNPEFISINLKTDSIELTSDVLKEIDGAYQELEKEIKNRFGLAVRQFRGLNEKYY